MNKLQYRIDTLHKKTKPVYIISEYLNEDGSLTKNMFPGKLFDTKEEAQEWAEITARNTIY